MAEEYGYQRSGKKCREKFENLYKYYKKTKEGKAGRQDGKHYRFCRQLEALYGDGDTSNHLASTSQSRIAKNSPLLNYQINPITITNNTNLDYNYHPHPLHQNKQSITESLSFSTTSEFETSSSENNDNDLSAIATMMNRSKDRQKGVVNESQSCARTNKKSWKIKVKNFVDLQMGKVIEKQEVWMERLLKTVEDRELERRCREEEWMKKEEDRLDREHEIWAKERAWIEARDAALMNALKSHAGNGIIPMEHLAIASDQHSYNEINKLIRWSESEILSLMQLRTAMEPRFPESGNSREFALGEDSNKNG